jgi:hypothetical protein
MNSRIAAELLYESEATLRMVDSALGELQMSDLENRLRGPRLKAVYDNFETEPAELAIPPEFCVRAYWQIHELLDTVRQSREAIQSIGRAELPPTRVAAAPFDGVDRALALIDRLDTLDDAASSIERQTLHDDLRSDLLRIHERADRASHSSDCLSAVTVLLAEAEARLTKLGYLFESGEAGEF